MDPQPLYTSIEKSIQTKLGSIILENPNRFPYAESNLYCLASNNKIIWKAEKPDPHTLYTRVRLNEDGATLSTYTQGGHACDLDLSTGKLLSQTTMK